MRLFCVGVVLCIGSGLATRPWSPIVFVKKDYGTEEEARVPEKGCKAIDELNE
jgi:hypothetical protein